jgi:hypothetical protein
VPVVRAVNQESRDRVISDIAVLARAERAWSCRHCEHFDGGGIGPDGEPLEFFGDCLSRSSPRFTTTADEPACREAFMVRT